MSVGENIGGRNVSGGTVSGGNYEVPLKYTFLQILLNST